MGHGDHEPPQAAPGRGTSLSRARTALVAAALVGLWGAAGAALSHELAGAPPAAQLAAGRARFWTVVLGSLALAGAAAAAGWAVGRRSSRAVARAGEPRAPAGAVHAGAIEAGDDLAAAAGHILDAVGAVAQTDAGVVYRLDRAEERLVAAAARGLTGPAADRLRTRGLDGTHAGGAARAERTLVTQHGAGHPLEPDLDEHLRAAGYPTAVSIPVRAGGRTWGVMTLVGRRARGFEAEELRLLETVADQMGVAVSRATLVAETQEKSRRLETLTRLAQTLTATLSVDEVLQRVVDAAAELFGSSVSRLWLVDDDGDTLSLRAAAGTPAAVPGLTRLRVGEGLVGRVVASRAPLVVADAAADPRVLNTERIRAEGSVSVAAVPVQLGDRVLGALSIAVDHRRDYTAEEMRLLRSLADQAAIAIDNARLFAAERARRAEMGSLLEINTKIGALPATAPLLSAVAEEAARLLGVDNAGFRLVEGGELVLAGLAGSARQTMLRERIRIGESFSGKVVATARTIVDNAGSVPDMIAEHRRAEEQLGYTTHLGVPLRVGERTIGVLAFRGRRPFSRRDVELAEAFAGQAAIALEHDRLYREAARQAERMGALADLGRLFSETLDPEVVSRRATDRLCALLGAASSTLYRIDPRSGDLITPTVAAEEGAPLPWTRILPAGHGLVGVAVRERRPVATADVLSDARVRYPAEVERTLRDLTHRAMLAVPLLVQDRPLGAFVVGDRTGRRFGGDEARLAQAFADHAALALDNARLYAEATRRRREAEELARIARTLTESLDPVAVGERIVESVLTLFGVRSSSLRLLEPDGSLVALAMGGAVRAHFARGHVLAPRAGPAERAVAEGRPVGSSDVFGDASIELNDDLARGIRAAGDGALLAVPLRVKERLIGALSIGDRPGRTFTDSEAALLQAFADQAALALENARLFVEESSRRARLAALADIEREFAAELDSDRLVLTIVERAERLFGAAGALYLVDGERRLGRRPAHAAAPADQWVEFGEGLVGRCAVERRPFVANDYPAWPHALVRWIEAGVRRAMGHPVLIAERLLGVIALHRAEPAAPPFREDDVALLEGLAAQAAIALENARIHHEREVRALRLRTLARLNQAVTGSLEPGEVLAEIARAAAQLMDAPVVTFWSADEAAETLELRASSDDAAVADLPLRSVAFGWGGVGWVARHRQPLSAADVVEDGRVLGLEWWRAHGLRSFHAIPIVLRGALLGVLAMNGRRPFAVVGEEQDLLETFVAQAAIALENARLFSETARRLEETRALLDIVAILNSSLDSRQVLDRLAVRIAQVCRVDRCSIDRREGDRLVPLTAQFAEARPPAAPWAPPAGPEPGHQAPMPAVVRAIESQRPVVIDAAAESDLVPREWVDARRLKSCMVVPLVRQEEVIGVLGLDYTDRPARFAPWQVDRALAIAGQVALSLENSRLFGEAQERLRETTTLLAVGRALSQPGSTESVMREVARQVAHAFGADMVGAYFLDERKEALVPLVGYHVPPELREFFVARPIRLERFPWAAEAWRTGRACWSGDTHSNPGFEREWVDALPPHSVLFAAATAHGEPIGGLFLVWWRRGREFPSAEIRLVEGVAAQVGLAMENADLARQTQVKLAETETLLSVSRALSATLDLDAVLRLFLRTVAATLGADSVGLWTLAADGDWMEGVAGYHIPPAYLEDLRRLRLSVVEHAFYAQAARTRRPVHSADVMVDPRFPEAFRRAAPHRSQLFVPIVANERLVGGLATLWWERAREFTAGELALMEAIASQAGVAIENARLFAENRRQVAELSVLHDLSRAVTGELDRAALLEAIREHIARVLDVSKIVIALRKDDGPELEVVLRVVDGAVDRRPPLAFQPQEVGLMSVVLETGRPLRADDYLAACAAHGVTPMAGPAQLRYWLGVPLRGAGDRAIGILVLRGADRPFTESDERLLANIAHLAALALGSAQLFAERTRAYGELAAAQDQLVRTEKLRALGEMASGVAHDFNNLLAAILGRAQLLLRRVQEPPLRQWLQVIERSALDGAQTVRRLQEFTRIRRDHPLVPVDLAQVVRDALEITQPRWRDEPASRGIAIEVRTALDQVPPVAGDPAELREAMTNLILNAVDAMPHGGTLALATRALDDHVLVDVRDTGVGMSPEVRERIFDPFFTTKGPQGTGLGLSMTYGILARHGASVTVESEEGRGALFRLSFLRSEPARAPAPVAAPAPAPSVSLRCLVVDDEQFVGGVLGDILATGGHQVVVLDDGPEAIARVRAEPFDVVFTDLAMPGVSGWQVARAVKDVAPGVPVFLVTGFGVELSAEERRGRGVAAILTKPLQIHEVLDAVAEVARRRGQPGRTEGDGWPTIT